MRKLNIKFNSKVKLQKCEIMELFTNNHDNLNNQIRKCLVIKYL